MNRLTLWRAGLLALALGALPAAAQTTIAQTTFTVNSTADDSNAQDRDTTDGVCEDSFTTANPSAEPRCTLRAAIDQANATSGDVIINLPGQLAMGASGTYTLGRVAPNTADNTYEDDNEFGDLDVGAGAAAFSSLTIRGTGTPGPQVTIGPNDRVFHLLNGNITIERVTITGGTAQPGDNGVSDPGMGESVDGMDGADGGCVLIASGVTATFDQLSVNNCTTSSGGNGAAPASGIARSAGGDAGNGGDGGGIANFGTLTLRKSFVAQNGTGDAGSAGNGTAGSGGTAAGGNGGNGGLGAGVFNAGTLTVEQSTVVNNEAGDPSAGAAGTNGGVDGVDGEGGSGGGIATIDGGSVDLSGSIVAGNTAGDDVNNNGTGSSATKQPGSDLFDGDPADDDGATTVTFVTGTFTDGGFNLVGSNNSVEATFPDTASGAAVDQNGTIVGSGQGGDASRVDPVITGANRNETFAVTAYEIGATSPAVDAGDPAIGSASITVDGRGFRRPERMATDSNGSQVADIGAFERDSEPVMGVLVINEIDSITTPTGMEPDEAEFIEIRNTSDTFTAQLADYAVVFFDGANDQAYATVNLSGTLAPGATVTLGDPGQGFDQTGGPFTGTADDVIDGEGAVGLYVGTASSYTGATAGQNASTRADVIVYDNADDEGSRQRRDAGSLADAFGVPQDEVASGDTDGTSIQRNGNGTTSAGAPTPGTNTMSGNVANVVINEVDSDTPSNDVAEFIELSDGGRGNTALDGLVLVFVNGGTSEQSQPSSYRSIDLDGFTTGPDGFFVVGNPGVANVDLTFTPGSSGALQNGPDAVALYQGDASSFPNGTAITPSTGTLLDVVSYGTADDVRFSLLDAFTYSPGRSARVQYEEDYLGDKDNDSLQRLNDAAQTDGFSLLLYAGTPTPGTANFSEVTVNRTADVADTAGWRLLSSPVISSGTESDAPAGTSLRIDFYAENINLVQGVPAGDPAGTYQAQYPEGSDNLFAVYNQNGGYNAPSGTDRRLTPGAGFFWYWYDNDVTPRPDQFGGGTSRSFDLGSPEFEFDVTGFPLDDRVSGAAGRGTPVQVSIVAGQDGFVMIGNPYAYPYLASGISANTGTLQDTFSAWDPAASSYVSITAEAVDANNRPDSDNALPVWQGVFAEVDGAEGTLVRFTAPSDFVVPTLETSAEINGIYRGASTESGERRLELTLTGTTDAGADVTDRMPAVRFLDTATDGWDRHDGTKLFPPTSTYALLAPVGVRDGEPYRQSVLSLPTATTDAEVPLAIIATAPGAYRIAWDDAALPAGLRAELVDLVTGDRAAVDAAGSYAFDLDEATDWTERFALSFAAGPVSTDAPVDGAAEVSAVYPNPATGSAQLDVRVGTAQEVRVEVYDALGRRVIAQRLDATAAETVRLETDGLAPGVYVVRVAGDGFQESRQLTIVR